MKNLMFIALFLSTAAYANLSATVSGQLISWPDTGGWMQVQDANSYETICDGFISTCAVAAGTYNVIDHSNSTRQENIVVDGLGASLPYPGPDAPRRYNTVTEFCHFPATGAGSKHRCVATCPAGLNVVSVLSCYAAKASSDGSQMPAGFISRGNFARCDTNAGDNAVYMEVSISCE